MTDVSVPILICCCLSFYFPAGEDCDIDHGEPGPPGPPGLQGELGQKGEKESYLNNSCHLQHKKIILTMVKIY